MWGFGFILRRFFTVSANTRSWPPFSLVDTVIKRTSIYKPSDDDPDLLVRLGQVLESWSWLEGYLRQSLSVLMDDNRDAAHAVYYSLHSLKARLDIIEAVAKYVVPDCDEKSGFLALITRTRRLSKFRNDLVHGEVHLGDKKPFQLIVGNSRNPDRFNVSDLSVSEIREHIASVDRLAEQFAMALTALPERYVQLASSRRKFPRQRPPDPTK